MGNGIAVILLYNEQTKFDKRLSARGISRTAYLGRLIHTLFNMIDIVIIEEESNEESVFDEDKSNGSDRVDPAGESAEYDMIKSNDYGVQDCEIESSNRQVADRCVDIRTGLGKSVEATKCGHEVRVQNLYNEFESSNCQMTERCKEERNGFDVLGLKENEGTTKSGDVSDMYSEPTSSDCQMDEEYRSQDEMDTNEDDTLTVHVYSHY